MFESEKNYFFEIGEIEKEEVRKSTINRIEVLTLELIEEISSNQYPKLTYSNPARAVHDDIPTSSEAGVLHVPNERLSGTAEKPVECLSNIPTSIDSSKSLSWVLGNPEEEEEKEDDGEGTETVGGGPIEVSENKTTVDFKRKKSRKNLVLMLTVMSHVHKMLINRTTKTRRSLYYELQSDPGNCLLAPTQRFVDDAVNHVASILDRAPWELGFTATSKGLVCGKLTFKLSGSRDSINCGIPGGVLIPQNIFQISSARTSARCVLVVEKDAVFQKLIEEDCVQYLNCILVTGKGYPDVNTRMLVSIIGNKLKIPVYVLVDADPFGVEIMCVYRFGSAIRSREREDLACPSARWIGIHPSEFAALGISSQALTPADKAKLSSLEARRYIDENIFDQLMFMRQGKVEIEAVAGLSYKFLTTVYLPKKIAAEEHF